MFKQKKNFILEVINPTQRQIVTVIDKFIIRIIQIMGADKSKPFHTELQNYKVLEEVPEANLTHLAHNQSNKEYLMRQLTFNDQNVYAKSLEQHKKRQAIQDPHLTHLDRVEGKSIDHLCSNIYKVYALWDYPYRFLSEEITERDNQHRRFEEKELWSILASCILAMSNLQKNKIRHQALTTKVLLLDGEGVVKVGDPLAHGNRSNLDRAYQNRQIKGIYLSPEQCQALQSRGAYSNPFKNDVWAAGMILLECGLLQSQMGAYKDQFQRIDHNFIQHSLHNFGVVYGQELKLIIELMLRKDSKDRPDWIDLQQYTRKQKSQQINTSNDSPQRQTPAQPPATYFQQHHPQPYPMPVHNHPPANQSYPIQYPPTYYGGPQNPLSVHPPPPQSQPTVHSYIYQPGTANSNSFIGTYSTINYQQGAQTSNNYQGAGHQSYPPPPPPPPPAGHSNRPMSSNENLFTDPNLLRQLTSIVKPQQNAKKQINEPTRQYQQSPHHANPTVSSTYNPPILNQQPVRTTIPINNSPATQQHQHDFQPHITTTSATYLHQHGPAQELEYVVETFKQGSKYEGYKLNDMRHGEGKFYYQDGGMYDGNWQCNKMDGFGSLYYQSGKLAYQGNWKNDKFQGKGKLFNEYPMDLSEPFDYRNFDNIDEYWEVYDGQFIEDFKKGSGQLKLSNGETFTGSFQNDMVEGPGTFHRRDGTVIRGIWHENHLQSQ